MKYFLCVFAFTSLSAFANIEHKDGMEGRPDNSRQAIAHSCFSELEARGCGHPLKDKSFFRQCAQENEETLSLNCAKLMKKLYGKRVH